MENLDVITIGEAMAMFVATETGDLAEVEHFMKRVAGAELNVATGLARLGLKVGWVSRVGNDSFGRFVLQSLAKEGIDSHAVAIDNRFATGFQMKSKVENGTDPIVEYFRKGSAASHLSPDDFRADYFTSARHLHLSGVAAALSESSYALLEHAAKVMKAEGKTQSAWKARRLSFSTISASLFHSTGQQTPEGIADFYLSRGVKAVVIKTGCDGAWFKSANGEQGTVDAIKVENVVDTVGAGDGFAVGVISALLEGKTLLQAVNRGNKIGSLAIQVQGDSEGLPTRDALGE